MELIDSRISKAKLVVFTYNVAHRKTYDVLMLLKAKGYKDVFVYAVPMSYKKKFQPMYEHRPKTMVDLSPDLLCRNLGYEYAVGAGYELFENRTGVPILICGAGIIPETVVMNNRIINAHPGYIPYARGLDALKWAIVENQPVGVTTHFLGGEIDAGEIIERNKVPIYENDTFHSVAQRVYETEICMLVRAIELVDERHEYISGNGFVLHKRMPMDVEEGLMPMFEEYKMSHLSYC